MRRTAVAEPASRDVAGWSELGRSRRGASPRPSAGGIVVQRRGGRGDPEGRIVEEGDLAVRMAHGGEPARMRRRVAPIAKRRRAANSSGATRDVDKVEQVLERERVIHRAELEMAAVREDLPAQLARQDAQAVVEPAFGFVAVEEAAGKDQCLGVGKR